MTRILLTPLIQAAEGGHRTTARLTAAPSYTVHTVKDQVSFAQIITWDFTEFTTPEVLLEPPIPGTAWAFALTVGAVTLRRTVVFHGDTVNWSDLTDVDPDTLAPLPVNEQLTAWEAVLQQLQVIASTPGPPGRKGDPGQPGTPGAGITAVSAYPLDPGAAPIALLSDELLQLGLPVGAKGDKGDRGDIGPIGPAGLTFRGTWNSGTDYLLHDAVYYNGASWFASDDPAPADTPGTASTWVPLAIMGQKGDPGVKGDPGSPGGTGPQGPAGVTSVSATGLAAGANPTATLTGQALALGIPAGTPGTTGTNGTNGADWPHVDSTTNSIGTTAVAITGPLYTGASFVDVRLVTSNYDVRMLLWVYRNPYTSTIGTVNILSSISINNSRGFGTPTWSVVNGNLAVAVPGSDGTVSARARMSQTGIN